MIACALILPCHKLRTILISFGLKLSYFSETYGFKRGDFPIAEGIGDVTISLPFYPNMPLEDVDRVIEVLREVLH